MAILGSSKVFGNLAVTGDLDIKGKFLLNGEMESSSYNIFSFLNPTDLSSTKLLFDTEDYLSFRFDDTDVTKGLKISNYNSAIVRLNRFGQSRFVNGLILDRKLTFTNTSQPAIEIPLQTNIPDVPTTERQKLISVGGNGGLYQTSGRGGLMLTSNDDSLVLANGDIGKTFNNTHLNASAEQMFLLSDNEIVFKSNLQNGWGTENTMSFNNAGDLVIDGGTVWHSNNLPSPVNSSDLAQVAYSGDWDDITNKPEQPVISYDVNRATLNDSVSLNSGFYTTSQGLPNPTNSDVEESSWWHVLNFKHGHNNGYTAQLALELSSGTDAKLQFRTSNSRSNGDSWTNWYKVYSEQYKPTWDDVTNKPDLTRYTRNGSSISLSGDVSGTATVSSDGSITISNTVVANDSHEHSNYVVQSSNATLNSLTTNQGLNVNGSLVQGTYKISNKYLTVEPNTTNYIYLGTYRTGIHELSFTTLGNSAYNNARYTLDICFDSNGNTKHQGTRIVNSIIGTGATEFNGLLAVKVTSDKAALYLKYVTPNASQNIYFSVKSDATNGRHDLSETESWTIPNTSNESQYRITDEYLKIDNVQNEFTYDGSQVLTTSSGKAVDSDKLDGLNSSQFLRSDASDTASGDITILKNNPWLTLDSSSGGDTGIEQAAGISIGESGKKGAAALHMTYTGDGKGWIGMGVVSATTSIPDHWAMQLHYQSNNVTFRDTPNVNGNVIWHAGNDGSGSGLDADMLDGLHASNFVRNDISQTHSASLTVNGNLVARNAYYQDTWRDAGQAGFYMGGNTSNGGQFFISPRHSDDTNYRWNSSFGWSKNNGWCFDEGLRVAAGGAERLEVNNTRTTVQNELMLNGYTIQNKGSVSTFNNELRTKTLYDVAAKNSNTPSFNGNVYVKLPPSSTSLNTFIKLFITIRDSYDVSTKIVVGGYATPGVSGFWNSGGFHVYVDTTDPRSDISQVSFGYDGTSHAIVITPNGGLFGSYPTAVIDRVELGWAGADSSVMFSPDGYSIDFVATTPTSFTNTTTLLPSSSSWVQNFNSNTLPVTVDSSNRVRFNNAPLVSGNTIWHQGNDGSGSGLDADKLDGLDSSSFLRSDTSDSFSRNSGIIQFSNTPGDVGNVSGSRAPLEILQQTSGKDAFMSFHVAGDYATYFGLDGSTNDLFVGGWSMGANKYRVYHEGNRSTLGVQTRKVIYKNGAATLTLNKSNMGSNGLLQLYAGGAGSNVSVDTSTFDPGSTITIKINNEGTTFRLKNLDDRIYLPDGTSVDANVEVTVSKACTIELEKPTGSNWLMLQIH